MVALNTFSYFDTGNRPSGRKSPERFYHGFVLGLIVDKADSYIVKSNRESVYEAYRIHGFMPEWRQCGAASVFCL